MVKKLQKQSTDKKKTGTKLPRIAKDAAQQIWLAGLGAFSKAQEEGSKVFDALVQEGLALQHETQAAAEEKIAAATSRVSGIATEVGSRVTGRWDKLENIFEDRVSKALSRLGVPSAREVKALHERIDALTKGQAATKAADKAAAKPAAKAPAKKAASATPAKKAAVKAAPRKTATQPAAKAATKPAAKASASKPAAKARAARPAQPTASAPSAPAPSTPSAS